MTDARALGTQRARAIGRELRAARRRHYLHEGDWVDSLYKAYVTVILAGLALFYGSLLLGNHELDAATVTTIMEHGASVLGLAVAVLVAFGLRSGARGGPLAPEAADVTYLFLAPIPRAPVLRSAAFRQLRGVMLLPTIAGALAGSIAAGKLGGDRAEWVLAGGAFGALASLSLWGAALVGSGAQLSVRRANAVGAVLVLWSVLDVATGSATAPTALVGRVALLPIEWSWAAPIGVALVLVLVGAGLALVGNVSLEPLQRRARLLGELRFAATLQDMRSVIVLHRELAQELPRSRPWWIVGAGARGGASWQRDWRGLARWPVARVLRVALLSVVAGLACVVVWDGTDAFLVVAGVAIFLAGIDAIEGLAQEADHADRSNLLPVRAGDLALAHVPAPACALVGFGVLGGIVFSALSGSTTALVVAAIVLVPIALLGAVSAATSVMIGAPPPALFLDFPFPEFGTLWLILRQVIAPLLVTAAFVPVAVAHDAWLDGRSPSGAAVAASLGPLALAFGASAWIRSRRTVGR